MKTSKKGIELIKKWEGCKLDSYKCSAGHDTIGYGNTFYEDGKKVKVGDKITKQRAEELLANLLPKFEAIVNKKVTVPLAQNQFDALVSYTWNTGGSSTLFDMINKKASDKDIRTWFETKYITAGGKNMPGLVNRGKDEANLYFTI